MNDMQQNTR